MKTAQARVLKALKRQTNANGITTAELASQLQLSRSVVSHYLNQLAELNQVSKIDGRPVRWTTQESPERIEPVNPFTNFIGSSGSLQGAIEKCIAAVTYPTNGLNIMITGDSGVGKSYLAKTIAEYARVKKIIGNKSPYLVLNCADYANNPELLSSILFGYVRGAYTGADQDRSGLLHEADKGYLLLDEVHRLSSENQEKLFNFIDTGVYYRMGDNVTPQHANVRLILATTEKPEDTLLTTFRRRIPVNIVLPTYAARPLDERIALVRYLLEKEAERIKKPINVRPAVVAALSQINHPGNIGYLKNIIQVGCATAYEQQLELPILTLDFVHFQSLENPDETDFDSMIIVPGESVGGDVSDEIDEELEDLANLFDTSDRSLSKAQMRRWINKLQSLQGKILPWELQVGFHAQHKHQFEQIIQKRLGLAKALYLEPLLFMLYRRHFKLNGDVIRQLLRYLKSKMPRSLQAASKFYRRIQPLDDQSQETLTVVLALLLSDYVDEEIPLRGLMIAHGENTATSIQTVVNTLCGNYVFDAIDMPIETGVDSIIKEVIHIIDTIDTTNGFILVVDMGSLSQLYSAIKSHLDGDLLVINNLTTVTALDLGLRMQQRTPFKEIAERADQDYTIDVQYYEGFAQTPNIVISCISGLGIAEKIQEIMQPLMPSDVKVIALEYGVLKEKLAAQEWTYFNQTLFVLTTMDLNQEVPIPNLNIYDLLDVSGTTKLREWLSPYLDEEKISLMNAQLLRFFSIEGVSERLSFLNPNVVIKEVESVITKYENYYRLKLDGKVKLNLYMHIALMIERLMVRRPVDEPKRLPDKNEAEFLHVSHSIFQPIDLKYNIDVSDYELLLMYELFKQFLSV